MSMNRKSTYKELDTQLLDELGCENPSEQNIRSLVRQGANVNAVDEYEESLLMSAITYVHDGLDIKFIQLLIDLGADVNSTEDGFNCLFHASLTINPDLIEMLLKAGADPNCINSSTHESILDSVEFDRYYHVTNGDGDEKEWAKMVQLLKDYGAKTASETFTDEIEEYIQVFSGYEVTGLATVKGLLRPESIPNITTDFVDLHLQWMSENPNKWGGYTFSEGIHITNPPDINDLIEHNQKGEEIARHIKKLVGPDIKVEYLYINHNEMDEHGLREVESKIIEI